MAKGSEIMSNRRLTSDMVGSINDGSSTMTDTLERKGGQIMSNRRSTSNMTGAYEIVGGYDIVGAESEIAAALNAAKANEVANANAKEKKLDTDKRHVQAALTIDKRIEKLLKPKYASCYASAATTKARSKFLQATVDCLFGMASDEGIAGMVNSATDVDKEIGGLALLQRAMLRRLTERSSYMSKGWLSRMFKKEKKTEDLLGTPGAKTAGFYDGRKGGGLMSNKSYSSMTNGYDIVGGGMEDIIGAHVITGMEDIIGSACYVGGSDAASSKIVAAMTIDARILGVLKPYWSAIYKIATKGTGTEQKSASISFLLAMLCDEGPRQMVTSTTKVDNVFGGMGLFTRAAARRVAECCVKNGWTPPREA